jgi:hypothetical protein
MGSWNFIKMAMMKKLPRIRLQFWLLGEPKTVYGKLYELDMFNWICSKWFYFALNYCKSVCPLRFPGTTAQCMWETRADEFSRGASPSSRGDPTTGWKTRAPRVASGAVLGSVCTRGDTTAEIAANFFAQSKYLQRSPPHHMYQNLTFYLCALWLQVQQIRVGNLKTAHFEASQGVPGMPRHSALEFGRLELNGMSVLCF